MPEEIVAKRSPTSQIYDFNFDFNINLARSDTNNTLIRMDISNVPRYWDTIVDAPGIQSRDLSNIESQFYAPQSYEWAYKLTYCSFREGVGDYNGTDVDEDISNPLFGR